MFVLNEHETSENVNLNISDAIFTIIDDLTFERPLKLLSSVISIELFMQFGFSANCDSVISSAQSDLERQSRWT